MFDEKGLRTIDNALWERSLLSLGDYLLQSGRQNHSFLINASSEPASWKRLLRGTGNRSPEPRKILQSLWDQLDAVEEIEDQLNRVIESASGLESWREALVKTPEAVEFCRRKEIRWYSDNEVYLLRKRQMNGEYAELFSFSLFINSIEPLHVSGNLKPLGSHYCSYKTMIGTDDRPHILMDIKANRRRFDLRIEYVHGSFNLIVKHSNRDGLAEIHSNLMKSIGFINLGNELSKKCETLVVEDKPN